MKELLNVVLDPAINHYVIGSFATPRTKVSDGTWFQTWSDWYTGLDPSQHTAASWAAIAPSSSDADCDNGYGHIARTASAIAQGLSISDGSYTASAAYNWITNTSGLSQACSANNPKWAVLPRSVAAPVAPTITSASPLTAGTVSSAYSVNLTATGDATITWSLTTGTLCTGLSLSSGGVITGTPTTAQTCSFTVTATNGVSPDAVSGTLSITVSPIPGNVATFVGLSVRGATIK